MIPSTSSSGLPIMKSTCITLLLMRAFSRGILDRMVVAVTERDVARGVLVDQRVVEHSAERPDATFAVDERDLAEP